MRYYFNIRDARGLIPDEEGSELPDMAAARHEADQSARDFALDDLRAGRLIDDRCIEITDADGKVLASVAVADIVVLHGR